MRLGGIAAARRYRLLRRLLLRLVVVLRLLLRRALGAPLRPVLQAVHLLVLSRRKSPRPSDGYRLWARHKKALRGDGPTIKH